MATDAANKIDYIEFQAADIAGRIAGGFSKSDKRSTVAAGGVLIVFYHPDLEKVRQRVIDLGGKVIKDIFSFPGGRRFHFSEPSGNECAIWSEEK